MSDKKISQLTALDAATRAATDVLPIVDVSAGETKKITVGQLFTDPVVDGGTANGVVYLNGSKALTSGSALTFDGSNLRVSSGNIFSAGSFTAGTNGGDTVFLEGVQHIFRLGAAGGYTTHYQIDPSGNSIWSPLGTEAMRLTSTGLGIGTSSPTSPLTVAGTYAVAELKGTTGWSGYSVVKTNGSLIVGLDDGATFGQSDGSAIIRNASGKGLYYYNSTTLRMAIDSSGNLGLGVTPSAWGNLLPLQIGQGASFVGAETSNSAYIASNGYYDASGAWRYIGTGTAGQYRLAGSDGSHAWFTAPSGTAGNAISFTQAMTLDASGNLLVGTTTTNRGIYGFHVTNNGLFYSSTDSSTNLNLRRLVSNGDVATFTATSGSIVGAITIGATTTTYNTSSDYRLKDNIQDITGSGAFIDALQPRTWNWKVDGSAGAGFIAHELQAVSPSSVVGEKDAVDADGNPEYQAVEYGSAEVIAMLVAEVKSLRARLTAAGIA